jgi:hypothetical protein
MKKMIILAAALTMSATAYPWGQKGHDTVAYIAECHLTPTTKSAVESLLDGHSIVYYANWLDNASHTDEYAYSKTWHYKNIDADETYRSARKNKKGDVVEAIKSQSEILRDTTLSVADRALALKMVVHFLGDIHQPMHLGHASDAGGNSHRLKYFAGDTNLHKAWDSQVIEAGHKWSYTEWQQQIDRATPEQEAAIIADKTPEAWGRESYELAKEIYEKTLVNYNISYDYIAAWTPVIELQLLRGGLRLADLLNSIFDSGYNQQVK